MAKINISFDDELLERLDNVAKSNYQTRSGLIQVACAQYINANELVLAMNELSLAMRKIADTGSVDEDTENRLKDYERMVSYLMESKNK